MDFENKAGMEGFEFYEDDAGFFIFKKETENIIYNLSWRFLLKPKGHEIDQLSATIFFKPLEKIINKISKDYLLTPSIATLRNSSKNNRTLFEEICSTIIMDEDSAIRVSNLFVNYLIKEISVFFEARSNLKGLGEYVLSNSFENIINIGLEGEYPLNVLKAITIAKWCKHQAKYQEYYQGLQNWIKEDRVNLNFSEKCDTYENALQSLIEKIEESLGN